MADEKRIMLVYRENGDPERRVARFLNFSYDHGARVRGRSVSIGSVPEDGA